MRPFFFVSLLSPSSKSVLCCALLSSLLVPGRDGDDLRGTEMICDGKEKKRGRV